MTFVILTSGIDLSVGAIVGIVSVVAAGMMAFSGAAAHPQGAGAGKLAEVLIRERVIVGTGSTNPPRPFEDETGNLLGFDIEMARLMAKGLFDDPEAVEFVREASDARIPNLQTNQVDVVFQFMTDTAQRAQVVEFSIPYYREGVGTLLLAARKSVSRMSDAATPSRSVSCTMPLASCKIVQNIGILCKVCVKGGVCIAN